MTRWQRLGSLGHTGICWTDRLSPAAGGLYFVGICIYIFPVMGLHSAQTEQREGWGWWCCQCWCECSVCLWSIQPAVYIYIFVVCTCAVCMHLLGIHLQPQYLSALGAWSGRNLASLRLPDEMYSSTYTNPLRKFFLFSDCLFVFCIKLSNLRPDQHKCILGWFEVKLSGITQS